MYNRDKDAQIQTITQLISPHTKSGYCLQKQWPPLHHWS